jgi:choline dehydrogenase
VCQLRPDSRGTVQIKSADPTQHPAIQPRYMTAASDRECMIRGMQLTRRIMNQGAIKRYVAEERLPGPNVTTDEGLLAYARETGTTIFHPTSTCRMGSDVTAVVDERLRVRGLEGLRVADASIMPTVVSGNTNAACVMIGEKASDMILADASAKPAAKAA